MSTCLYVRTTMTVPGVGTAIHLAELEEINAEACTMLRMIAMAPNGTIVGAASPTKAVGKADLPQQVVPHPDTYDQFPDIDAALVDADSFHALWSEATAIYGDAIYGEL